MRVACMLIRINNEPGEECVDAVEYVRTGIWGEVVGAPIPD